MSDETTEPRDRTETEKHELRFHLAMVEIARARRGFIPSATDMKAMRHIYNGLWQLAPQVCRLPLALGTILGDIFDHAPEVVVEGMKFRRLVLDTAHLQQAIELQFALHKVDPYAVLITEEPPAPVLPLEQ